MDVTKSSYKYILPDIKKSINTASFLSIDCEFTGLNSGFNINSFDSQKQYYDKLKKGSENFIIIQFGLCIFRYDADVNVFKQNSYNFYIFPRQLNKNAPDRRFLCQASSIDFLTGNNFDFNKLFQDGITYLNKSEETKYLESLQERQKLRANQAASSVNQTINYVPIPEEDKDFINNTMKIIENFSSSIDEELMLPKCSTFLRRLIYQTVSERYGTSVNLETRIVENKERQLFVLKITAQQRVEKEKKRCEQELMELEDAVGFSTVIQYIAESGKLIIGHNLLLDILHTVDMFLTPLPEKYEDFKECLHCLFPRIIDTKFMANSYPFRESIMSSVLGQVLDTVSKEPFEMPTVEIEDGGHGYSIDNDKQHEAGYDAYITGLCFLAMSQYLGKLDGSCKKQVLPDSPLVKPFINKLFLMKLHGSPFMNLMGSDFLPSRDHVLHIAFPKEWKLQDITQLFSPFGHIYVAWIDEKSAYVALAKHEQAALALNALCESESCTLISYAQYQALSETNLPVTPSPLIIRKKPTPEKWTVTKSRKRRTIGFSEESSTTKRVCGTIEEQPEESIKQNITTKTFMEDSSWS